MFFFFNGNNSVLLRIQIPFEKINTDSAGRNWNSNIIEKSGRPMMSESLEKMLPSRYVWALPCFSWEPVYNNDCLFRNFSQTKIHLEIFYIGLIYWLILDLDLLIKLLCVGIRRTICSINISVVTVGSRQTSRCKTFKKYVYFCSFLNSSIFYTLSLMLLGNPSAREYWKEYDSCITHRD